MATTADLAGQRILVVGGARDIGYAVAEGIAAAGGTPIVGARDEARAAKAAEQISGAEPVLVDITDETSIVAALAAARRIDHVVVTASAHHNAPLAELDHGRVVTAFEAKVIGPLMLAKHAARILPPTGSLVLFSGLAGWKPAPDYSIMGITNGAVAFAAAHLAKELAPIRVNAVSPGVIDSGSWDELGEETKREFLEGAAANSLVGRTGTNADITDAVLWLIGAGFVTGETIHVAGGRLG